MRAAPVTGHTGDGWDHYALIVLIEIKVFLVDFSCHGEHVTGNILFRFCITGEVQVMVRTVSGRGVTEIAFDAQCGLPAIHRAVQLVMADILVKYF